jgi:hypothetical protein
LRRKNRKRKSSYGDIFAEQLGVTLSLNTNTPNIEFVILQRLCHPLREKGKCHHDGKGDIEQQRAKTGTRL